MIRAVKRGRHADDVLDADMPLAGRPSTVRSRLDRPAGKVAAFMRRCPQRLSAGSPGKFRPSSKGTIVGRAVGEHVYDVGTAR